MNTIVCNWQIVSVIDNGEPIGDVLWGICVDDMTFRFSKGDYICTSKIIEVNFNTNLIKTHSGSIYQIIDIGKHSTIDFSDFELLRSGFSPEQIEILKCSKSEFTH
jgi:hypothetical protein